MSAEQPVIMAKQHRKPPADAPPAPAKQRSTRRRVDMVPGRDGPPPAGAATAPEPPTIADRIVARRLAAGLSQQALADLLDPPGYQSTITKVEISGDRVSHEKVVQFAKALGCDPCDLDHRLAPEKSLSLARAVDPFKGVGWEPLRAADRAVMDGIWDGQGPGSAKLGELVDRAAEDGVAVVLRGDLPVKIEGRAVRGSKP